MMKKLKYSNILRKNNYILFNGIPYYFFIIERVYVNSNIPPDFILRVSEEKKFNDLNELKFQIEKDEIETIRFLDKI